MEAHYQRAGVRGAYDSGREAGKLLLEFGGYATGAVGVTAGAASITAKGVRLASKQVEKFGVPKVTSVNQSTTGIKWGEGIRHQGMPWENYVGTQLPQGSRLPPNFKTFDYYNPITRTAISVKTLDTTTAARVANPKQIYTSLKGNIDPVVKFQEYELDKFTLSSDIISSREIHLAIPSKTASAQWTQINRAIEYGQSQNVKVVVTTVR
ncbi:endonuclease toxin domain-containing protein [Yersinia aleksiciae]|uniref:endonuclease toxin domain-containing protein n=1 Tax=Yersinia aleksiciae TaxID=263819 RepID=UPI0021BD4567|nr:hypothetical protein [Yersinia aleksiciae]